METGKVIQLFDGEATIKSLIKRIEHVLFDMYPHTVAEVDIDERFVLAFSSPTAEIAEEYELDAREESCLHVRDRMNMVAFTAEDAAELHEEIADTLPLLCVELGRAIDGSSMVELTPNEERLAIDGYSNFILNHKEMIEMASNIEEDEF